MPWPEPKPVPMMMTSTPLTLQPVLPVLRPRGQAVRG
jgi:hypothetical protein